ncbi:hypothetical protein J6590_106686, partial [Homalodisca vitripennis]
SQAALEVLDSYVFNSNLSGIAIKLFLRLPESTIRLFDGFLVMRGSLRTKELIDAMANWASASNMMEPQLFCGISRTGRLVVCIDSLSALRGICDIFLKNILVLDIYRFLHYFQYEVVFVTFVWVPGHVGISGNVLVDKGGKYALQLQHLSTLMVASDIVHVVRAKLKARWSSEWWAVDKNKL